jgi:anti-sigma regulatory factor (Ser/Thr protein kinase)
MVEHFQHRAVIQEVPIIRKNLTSVAQKWGIPKSEQRQILFIIEELFSNITRYGFTDNREHLVDIMVKIENGAIFIEIVDDGLPFDPLTYKSGGETDPVSLNSGGMGLSLVRAFSDSISYQRNGEKNQILITKRIKSGKE